MRPHAGEEIVSTSVINEPNEPSSIWKWLGPLASLLVFAAVAYVLHREIAHLHFKDIVHHLRSIPRSAVVAALAITALSYFVLSCAERLCLLH